MKQLNKFIVRQVSWESHFFLNIYYLSIRYKDHFFKTASYWNNTENDPELFQIDDVEALDVDTETDFLISESIYKATLS